MREDMRLKKRGQSQQSTERIIRSIVTVETVSYTHLDVYKRQVESSNEDVVKIITLADENGYPIYKARAMKEGKSTICLLYTSRCV